MKTFLAIAYSTLIICSPALAAPFENGNIEKGRQIHETHRCTSCHASYFLENADDIYLRKDRKIKTPASLLTQINRCVTEHNLMLFEDDEENVAAYLNEKFYKFK